ncbi:hypothetical protein [Bradyrhizobium sp. CW1]|jgi:hypothetical protein|uniref:hypothetical protein n=1 Tax=Bradyrhizobium sp. CW1 TaxID=2782686 RepID=UPI001FFFDEE2|nr:hypothetical protein [Bradyrhizobium sp. CW1]
MYRTREYLECAENCAQLAEQAQTAPAARRYQRMEAAGARLPGSTSGWTGGPAGRQTKFIRATLMTRTISLAANEELLLRR